MAVVALTGNTIPHIPTSTLRFKRIRLFSAILASSAAWPTALRRMGRLEILLPAEARLQLRISPNEEMTYSGPVWEDRAWRNESFAVVVEPVAFLADQLTIVSVSESDAVPALARSTQPSSA